MSNLFLAVTASVILFPCMIFADLEQDLAFIESQVNTFSVDFEGNKEDLNMEIVSSNIDFLEAYIKKAIKGCEKKLEKYKSGKGTRHHRHHSSSSSIGSEIVVDTSSSSSSSSNHHRSNSALKKIEATEKKIRILKELLFGLQVLKLKIGI